MSNLKRSPSAAGKPRAPRPRAAQVIDLEHHRHERHRSLTEQRVRKVLEENRAALKRLFASGLIFTQKGSRAGRDLLGAQMALLKLIDLIARTVEAGGARLSAEAGAVFAQLETQLARTSTLTARTGQFLSGRGGE